MRLVNYPKDKCANDERLIKWSQQGPAGPAGAQGAQGPQRGQGPKGDQGPAGPGDWNAIPNKPAGFADGVDDGVTSLRLTLSYGPAVDISRWWVRHRVGDLPGGVEADRRRLRLFERCLQPLGVTAARPGLSVTIPRVRRPGS